MSEFESEPIRGLPEHLPAGEHILWQGAPNWRSLARRAFHVRMIAGYFVVLAAWSAIATLFDGGGAASAAMTVLWICILGGLAIGLFALIAWLVGRTTVYTITERRLVMRIGIAMPMTINIPLRLIESAAVKTRPDRSGDIPIRLTGSTRIGYVILWPHARPWRLAKPEPMLRAVPDAEAVATILARALCEAAGTAATAPANRQGLRRRPATEPLAAAS